MIGISGIVPLFPEEIIYCLFIFHKFVCGWVRGEIQVLVEVRWWRGGRAANPPQ